jgi:hypothetical protein
MSGIWVFGQRSTSPQTPSPSASFSGSRGQASLQSAIQSLSQSVVIETATVFVVDLFPAVSVA